MERRWYVVKFICISLPLSLLFLLSNILCLTLFIILFVLIFFLLGYVCKMLRYTMQEQTLINAISWHTMQDHQLDH